MDQPVESKQRRFVSLHRRLIVLLLLVGLLPLLVVAMLNNLQSARTLTDLANSQLRELAVSSMEKIERDLFDRYGNVQAFANSDGARAMDPLRIIPLMTRMTNIYAPFYRLMIVADSSGTVIAASSARPDGTYLDGASLIGQTVRGEEWFEIWQERRIRPGTVFVDDVHVDRRVARLYGDDGYVVGFSHGIFNQSGTLIGVWLNLVDWNTEQAILRTAEQRPQDEGATTVRLTLVNRDGLILSNSADVPPLSRSYVPDPGVLVEQAQSQGYADKDFGLNWSVIATQQRTEALATAQRQTLQTLLSAVGLGVLVVLVGLLAARLITRPLQTLQVAADQVAAGNLQVNVPVGPGEIGQVAQAFNSMTSQLRGLYASLEEQVTQRTAQLEVTLNDLQQRSVELQLSQEQLSATNRTLAESEQRYRSLFERTQEVLNETEVLYRTARSLIGSEQLGTVLQSVVDGAVDAISANAVSLMTIDMDAREVTSFVRGGPGSAAIELVAFDELLDGLSGWVLRHEKPALSPGSAPDPRESTSVQQRRVALDNGSIIVVPLLYRSTMLGTMTAINRRDQREFTPHDVELLVTMANQAAVALQNARLYAAAQQELAERRRVEEELRSYQEHLEEQVATRTAELAQVAAELGVINQHLREGVALARDIQVGLLPDRPPWDLQQLNVFGMSLAASEVGGDFYTYIATPNHAGGMVAVGDISGKGIGAALMMALTTSALETEARTTTAPAVLLNTLNQTLAARLRGNQMNAAVLLVSIDQDRQEIVAANAGMIAPLLIRDGAVHYIDVSGFPLGTAQHTYQELRIAFEPNDLLLLVSDGVVEAHNSAAELYGFERLEHCIRAIDPAISLNTLIEQIMVDILRFTGSSEQHDDITVVALRPASPLMAYTLVSPSTSDEVTG